MENNEVCVCSTHCILLPAPSSGPQTTPLQDIPLRCPDHSPTHQPSGFLCSSIANHSFLLCKGLLIPKRFSMSDRDKASIACPEVTCSLTMAT